MVLSGSETGCPNGPKGRDGPGPGIELRARMRGPRRGAEPRGRDVRLRIPAMVITRSDVKVISDFRVNVLLGRGDPNERCWSMTGSRTHSSSGRIGRSRAGWFRGLTEWLSLTGHSPDRRCGSLAEFRSEAPRGGR